MCYLQLNVYNYLQIFFTVCVLSKLTVFEIFLKNMINHKLIIVLKSQAFGCLWVMVD